MADTPEQGQGRIINGRYRLLRQLGAGGMGRVWLAYDDELACEVSMKEISLPDVPMDATEPAQRIARARSEARHAARLRGHPHVATVHDVVLHEGLPWIVMEYVPDAVDLQAVVRQRGPLAPEQVARIGLAVLDALTAGHRIGILHRDVKPANILLAADASGDPYARVLLTDYGIALQPESREPRLTATAGILGTPGYLAPERARGEPPTPAADMFSLGATLYAAVEGRGPFDRHGEYATLTALLGEEPTPPVRAGELAPVLHGLLIKDPVRRLSPEAVARGLERVADAGSEPSQPGWGATPSSAPASPPTPEGFGPPQGYAASAPPGYVAAAGTPNTPGAPPTPYTPGGAYTPNTPGAPPTPNTPHTPAGAPPTPGAGPNTPAGTPPYDPWQQAPQPRGPHENWNPYGGNATPSTPYGGTAGGPPPQQYGGTIGNPSTPYGSPAGNPTTPYGSPVGNPATPYGSPAANPATPYGGAAANAAFPTITAASLPSGGPYPGGPPKRKVPGGAIAAIVLAVLLIAGGGTWLAVSLADDKKDDTTTSADDDTKPDPGPTTPKNTGPVLPYGEQVGLTEPLKAGDCVSVVWSAGEAFESEPNLGKVPCTAEEWPNGQVVAVDTASTYADARDQGAERCERQAGPLAEALPDAAVYAVVPTKEGFEAAGGATACLVLGEHVPIGGEVGQFRDEGLDLYAAQMAEGDCWTYVDKDEDTFQALLTECSQSHTDQVIGSADAPDNMSYQKVLDEGGTLCKNKFESTWAAGSELTVYGWVGSKEDWGKGFTEVVCTVGRDDGQKTTGKIPTPGSV